MNLRLTWSWVPHHRPQQEFLYRICCHVFANGWSWTTIWPLRYHIISTCCIIWSEPFLCEEKHIISFPFSELHSCASRAQLVEQPDKARWIIWKPASGRALKLGVLHGWQYIGSLTPPKMISVPIELWQLCIVYFYNSIQVILYIYIYNIFETHTSYAGSAPGSVLWAFSKFIAETSTCFWWLERQISLVEAHLQVCRLCHSFCKYDIFLEVL